MGPTDAVLPDPRGRTPPRTAQAAAIFGVSLQLIGISWDGWMHSADPSLVQRESVFSVTNPSHALIALGLALTVGGVTWLYIASSRAGSAPTREVVGVLALIAVLSVGTGVVAASTGGLPGLGGHDHGNLPRFEVLSELEELVRTRGTEAAIARLDEVAANNPGVAAWAHQIIHKIGRLSYEHYGDTSAAFARCTQAHQSGCYHGVLEAHIIANPVLTRETVSELCDTALYAGTSKILRSQCVHGLGHGLSLHFNHDLIEALFRCDYLRDRWGRHRCYSGAFMENIIFWAGSHGTVQNHHGAAEHKVFVKQDDPYYPCSILAKRYLQACFRMQTSIMLSFNNSDFEGAFALCDAAPVNYRGACYRSMGRDISAHTLRDREESLELCARGTARYAPGCYVGVARNMTAIDWDTSDAFAFCASAPIASKKACYRAIGHDIEMLFETAAERRAECRKAPRLRWVAACERGARVI